MTSLRSSPWFAVLALAACSSSGAGIQSSEDAAPAGSDAELPRLGHVASDAGQAADAWVAVGPEAGPEVQAPDLLTGQRDAGVDAVPDAMPPVCSVLLQTGCPDGQACYLGSRVACAPVGTVVPWGNCTNANDCTAGHTCLTDKCVAFCSPSSGGYPSCDPGVPCTSLNDTRVPGVGYCRS